MMLSIPVAWLQLIRQRVRLLVTVAGIAFIVVLMFIQLGFQDALYSSATQVHRHLQGELFILSAQYKSLTSNQSFSRSRLYQVLGFNGVESVHPIYAQFAKVKNLQTGQKYPIYVLGFDASQPVLNMQEINQNLSKIRLPNIVLFDRSARPEFGSIAQDFVQGKPTEIEVFSYNATKGYRVKVGGLFSLGPSFGVDGNLIVDDSTFLRIFYAMGRQSDGIDIGIVTLKPGVNPEFVLANLKQKLSPDVQVFTREQFIKFEKDYWARRTPIGFTLNLMLIMGTVIGIVIVYQILYSNISTHLTAYATLKAIGYSNGSLVAIVFQQAFFLALFAYVPAWAISFKLFDFAKSVTRLPITMQTQEEFVVLIFTVSICLISGVLTMNKLRSADPADVF